MGTNAATIQPRGLESVLQLNTWDEGISMSCVRTYKNVFNWKLYCSVLAAKSFYLIYSVNSQILWTHLMFLLWQMYEQCFSILKYFFIQEKTFKHCKRHLPSMSFCEKDKGHQLFWNKHTWNMHTCMYCKMNNTWYACLCNSHINQKANIHAYYFNAKQFFFQPRTQNAH